MPLRTKYATTETTAIAAPPGASSAEVRWVRSAMTPIHTLSPMTRGSIEKDVTRLMVAMPANHPAWPPRRNQWAAAKSNEAATMSWA